MVNKLKKRTSKYTNRTSRNIEINTDGFRKTLGVMWSPLEDNFSFHISEIDCKTKFMKRMILSIIANVYDSLGWMCPCIMFAKLIMQKLWLSKTNWDDVVENDSQGPFQNFIKSLPSLSCLRIPRWTKITDETSKVTLIGFCDASEKGYAGVVYLLTPNRKLHLLTCWHYGII